MLSNHVALHRLPSTRLPACTQAGTSFPHSPCPSQFLLIQTIFTLTLLILLPQTSFADVDIRRDATVAAVERVMPAVVNVSTETIVASRNSIDDLFREFFDPYYRDRGPNTSYSVGSGVIIDEEGHILTNHHVVGRASRITVKLMDGREFEAKPLTSTAFADVALLRIVSKPGEKFTAVKFAGDDDLLLGETVIALGNPFGLGGSVSRGILSSKARRPPNHDEPLDIPDWLQIDAAINPGNSGGPLVNLRGELIGINVAVSRQGQGIGFAIPIRRISAALAELYTPETFSDFWLGARFRPQTNPVQVMDVENDSPAALAGILKGDLILSMDGTKPRSSFGMVDNLVRAGTRKEVEWLIQRGDQRYTAHIRMIPEKAYFNADLLRRKLGIQAEEVTQQTIARLGINFSGGLMVNAVDIDSPAQKAGIQRGMIITSIDGQTTSALIRTARLLNLRDKGKSVKIDLLVPVQRGRFIEVQQASVQATVR